MTIMHMQLFAEVSGGPDKDQETAVLQRIVNLWASLYTVNSELAFVLAKELPHTQIARLSVPVERDEPADDILTPIFGGLLHVVDWWSEGDKGLGIEDRHRTIMPSLEMAKTFAEQVSMEQYAVAFVCAYRELGSLPFEAGAELEDGGSGIFEVKKDEDVLKKETS
jgi:hypothetical protein